MIKLKDYLTEEEQLLLKKQSRGSCFLRDKPKCFFLLQFFVLVLLAFFIHTNELSLFAEVILLFAMYGEVITYYNNDIRRDKKDSRLKSRAVYRLLKTDLDSITNEQLKAICTNYSKIHDEELSFRAKQKIAFWDMTTADTHRLGIKKETDITAEDIKNSPAMAESLLATKIYMYPKVVLSKSDSSKAPKTDKNKSQPYNNYMNID